MFHPDVNNRAKMTKGERALADAKIVGKRFRRIFSYIWIVIVIIIISAWLIFAMLWLTGGGANFGG